MHKDEAETKREQKIARERRLKRAESLCLRWSLTLRDYPREISQLDKEIDALRLKRTKLTMDLHDAPKELEKAQVQFQKAKSEQEEIVLAPKVARFKRAREELAKILAMGIENLDLSEEQLELLRNAKVELKL